MMKLSNFALVAVLVSMLMVSSSLAQQGGGGQGGGGGGGGGSGTVTSVGVTVPTGLNVSPASITTSGTFAITWSGLIPTANLGTGTASSSTCLLGNQTWGSCGTSGANITVNGGSNITSPVNFENGASTDGIAINFANPSGSNITAGISGALTSAGLNITPTTCTNQFVSAISSGGVGTCTSAGTVTSVSVTTANGVSGTVATSTTTPAITLTLGAITPTSMIASGIVDGTAPVTITTGTTANLGSTYSSGYTFNQEGTAGTGVTYTLPATAVGKQYCVANSGTTSVVNTGALTVYPPASSYVILNGVVNTIGGGGTHGVASGGAAGDAACFVAIDSTHWQVYVGKGTWTEN